MSLPKPRIASERYTTDYFQKHCGGAELFSKSHGETLPIRMQRAMNVVEINRGDVVLDIGCGRGEVMAFCANAGARVISLDYASAAIEIAKSVMQEDQIAEKTVVVRADARTLPVSSRSIDVAFMLDVVEHLTYDELITSLTEVERVLKKNGRLIVHTMPNTWYYRFGYPIHRLIMRATGTSLPLDPRTRWSYVDTHVNEQSPYSLGRAMRQAKLDARIWVASSHESSAMPFRRIYDTVVKLPLLSNFVCNDIYAVGKPRQ